MCKAHVLRFSCGHGILMGVESCRLGPCPILKPTGVGLPQQPYRCYNCQHKLTTSTSNSATARDASCTSSVASAASAQSFSSTSTSSSSGRRPQLQSTPSASRIIHPLPGVARQPTGAVQYCHNYSRDRSATETPFSFSCQSSSHFPTPHYATLPGFLPHQDHPCPPCQLEELRASADYDVTRQAMADYPKLTGEMMVRNGRRQDEWEGKLTLDRYVEERRVEEREMWLHVCRKWTQDLRKARVLVAEEDGLGLLG